MKIVKKISRIEAIVFWVFAIAQFTITIAYAWDLFFSSQTSHSVFSDTLYLDISVFVLVFIIQLSLLSASLKANNTWVRVFSKILMAIISIGWIGLFYYLLTAPVCEKCIIM